MKVDNFETIAKKVLKFLPTKSPNVGDTFYEIRILKPNAEGRYSLMDDECKFKSYYPNTPRDVLDVRDEIIRICSALGYKAVININPKSMTGVSLELLKMLAIKNADGSISHIRPWTLLDSTIGKSNVKWGRMFVVSVPSSIDKRIFITEANKIINNDRLKHMCRTEIDNPSMNFITSTKDESDYVYDNVIAVLDKNESTYNVVIYNIGEADEIECELCQRLGRDELILVDESGWCPLFEC